MFSNFIICPFLYSLQPSTYDKVAFILNDMGWDGIPKNHSAFRRGEILSKKEFPIFVPPQFRTTQEAEPRIFAAAKIEREE